jgi:hypothetical protein
MMKEIGQEMHQLMCALAISNMASLTILDMCMASGGFLATTLDINPGAHTVGFSLPISLGGYKVLLPKDPAVTLKFLDITMLAADMDMKDIPEEYPEAKNLLSQQVNPGQLFDLILCDGQVLWTYI